MAGNVTFHDYKPQAPSLLDAVENGLAGAEKSIPPKFFYDETGSRLFDRICEQPEYYLPDAERQVLLSFAGEIADIVGAGRVVVEPGAGAAIKIRWLLKELRPAAYVPIDISGEYLSSVADSLTDEYPWLEIHAVCADYTHAVELPDTVPEGARLVFFPGSTLGNFEPEDAQEFLRELRQIGGEDGMLLIGVDTKKSVKILDAAYNDAAGVTAEFNLNLLHRIRDELEAHCDPSSFEHEAFYDDEQGRVEMHLVSREDQVIRVNGNRFDFAAGERVNTEYSYKYSPDEFQKLAEGAGYEMVKFWLAEDDLFGVYLLRTDKD